MRHLRHQDRGFRRCYTRGAKRVRTSNLAAGCGAKAHARNARSGRIDRQTEYGSGVLSTVGQFSLWSGMRRQNLPDTKRIVSAILSVCLLLGLFFAGPAQRKASAESASKDFKMGQAAEAQDNVDAAYDYYRKALQKDPQNGHYKTAYERLKFSAAALHTRRGEKLRE